MTRMTRRGATVELAIASALEALGVTREEVEVEVIDQGKKGFLGFGAKEAEVTVTVLSVEQPSVPDSLNEKIEIGEEPEPTLKTEMENVPDETVVEREELQVEGLSDEAAIQETANYLQGIATGMGIDDLQIQQTMDGKYVHFQLESSKAAMLIGKRGQTLNALQQLAQLIANKSTAQFKVVRIDVGDYRERREQSLEQLAERMADKAVRTGRKVQLEPMPAYERKVIHHALSNRLDIETYSEGSDPFRYLIIEAVR
ncbi:protein jag [Sporosarcina sp. ACRSM]|uniref:RNA-binding cell elongation regulator Jag/EloR n=1 Tax=Sporosarcina sp. ACRSM TaxID=2918216 RepID=UPI001EF49835|nr:RNA-binding cell elongation regulator Jag/EloR [Sporosarcina sp. ACRSM]MCG7335104.1 protein jag [Sporosarcina sp. ACRSM]